MDEIEFRDTLQKYELGQLELSGYVRTDFINFIKTLLDKKDALVSELDEEIESLKREVKELEGDINSLEGAVSHLERENERLLHKLEEIHDWSKY